VKRLPLKPSATAALLPMFEAVSNGIHAIDDRHGKAAKDHGKVHIEVLREDTEKAVSSIIGFVVTDNGIGLNDDNYRSFLKPDSQHKIQRGGKGVGRLGWLKVHKDIRIDSSYLAEDGTTLKSRSFDFVLREDEQVVPRSGASVSPTGPGTRVSLKFFDPIYGGKCPVDPAVVKQRIIGHFMQLLAADIAPSITVADGSETTDLREVFKDLVKEMTEEKVDVQLDGDEAIKLKIRHIRASKSIRPDTNRKNYNWIFLSANQRAVEDSPIDEAIGLKMLDGDEVYVGCVYGEYLDAHVNQERTGFSFDASESREIRRALIGSAMSYLGTYVTRSKEQKRRTAKTVIESYPQFLYLNGEMEDFVNKLPPGANSKEQVFLEMCRNRFRKTNTAHRIEAEVKAAPTINEDVEALMAQYQSFVQDQQRGVLAEYVLLRKSVIDILDRYIGYREGTEKHHLEEAVHKLVVPMRRDSADMEILEHNLWLLDDRLSFFSHFASDRPFRSYTDNTSLDRPDVAFFYDTCFAWQERDAGNTVVLVEFKKPGRDNYDGDDNPLRQLIGYIRKFTNASLLRDTKGRVLNPRLRDAAFHCYIVADITPTLEGAFAGFPFHKTPDGEGLIGYRRNPDAYVEVISYAKLLADAKMRSAVFFQKLGISNVDPAYPLAPGDEADGEGDVIDIEPRVARA
jgi:hypothetical protein